MGNELMRANDTKVELAEAALRLAAVAKGFSLRPWPILCRSPAMKLNVRSKPRSFIRYRQKLEARIGLRE